MKIFVVANFAVMVLCWVLVTILGLNDGKIFKERHPEFVRKKASLADAAHEIIRFTLVAICPILNIYEVYILLFRYDEVRDEILERAEEAYSTRLENPIKVLCYTVCWGTPNIFGSDEYGHAHPETEEEAFALIQETGRNVLRRTVKQRDEDGLISYPTQWYDFENKVWHNLDSDY